MPSTSQVSKIEPPRSRRRDRKGHHSFGGLHQWLGAAALCVEVILLVYTIIELVPHVLPEPALVWSSDDQTAPGFKTVVFSFRNPSHSVPLQGVEARWTVNVPDVKLTAEATAPEHTVSSPTESERVFRATANFSAGSSFRTYLHCDKTFDVHSHTFSAQVPRISTTATFTQPADVISGEDWKRREWTAYKLMAGIAILLAAGIFGFHRLILSIRPTRFAH